MLNKNIYAHRLISIILLLSMSLICLPVFATGGDAIKFTVSGGEVKTGGSIPVTLTLDKQLDVSTMQFTLKYDPDKFQITSTDKISLHSDLTMPNVQKSIDNVVGTATVVVMVGETTLKITPPLVVATYTLTAKSDATLGSSTINLTDCVYSVVDLTNTVDGLTSIPVTVVNNTITIVAPTTSGGGSHGTTVTPSPSPIPSPSIPPTITPEPNFTDVNGWEKEYVDYLAKKGIINGRSETIFAPNDNINRAEFVAILGRIGQVNEDAIGEALFNDVSTTDWYSSYVTWAFKKGIIKGYGDGRFAPDQQISREEICVMIVRALKSYGIELPSADLTFDDASDVSDWAKESVAALAKAGIISGKGDNKFAPQDNATRAECAKMITGAFKVIIEVINYKN